MTQLETGREGEGGREKVGERERGGGGGGRLHTCVGRSSKFPCLLYTGTYHKQIANFIANLHFTV